MANVVSKYRKAIDRIDRARKRCVSRKSFPAASPMASWMERTIKARRGFEKPRRGPVEQILRDGVVCKLDAPLKRGDGIVFDAGDPTKKKKADASTTYAAKASSWRVKRRKAGSSISFPAGVTWTCENCMSATGYGRRTIRRWISASVTYETEKSYRVFPAYVSGRADLVDRCAEGHDGPGGTGDCPEAAAQPGDPGGGALGRLGGTVFRG